MIQDFNQLIQGSTVVITGGTGSFGSTFARHLLATDVAKIKIFSRDEFKQDKLRKELSDPRVEFIIGDVRNYDSVSKALRNTHYVFHAAAMKQVPSCEAYPFEAVQTNIVGSMNVVRACQEQGVERAVFLSTDKAVQPVNAMGLSKAMMEKIVLSAAKDVHWSKAQQIANCGVYTQVKTRQTTLSLVRYGNVLMTRGSVIPLFLEKLRAKEPLPVTSLDMTRFILSLDDAIELVKCAFVNASAGDLFIRKAPACTVEVILEALHQIFDQPPLTKIFDFEIKGIRPGEKIHETLATQEELSRGYDHGQFIRITNDPDALRFVPKAACCEDFTSSNANSLTPSELADILLTNREFLEMTKGML